MLTWTWAHLTLKSVLGFVYWYVSLYWFFKWRNLALVQISFAKFSRVTHTHTHSEIQKPLHHGEASCAASNRRRRGGREDIWFCSHNCMPIYLKICSFFFLDFLLSYSFYLVCRRSHTLAHSASIPTLSGLSENFCTVFCRYSTCKWVHFYQFVALLQNLEAREGCQCIERLGYLARQ